ncbi:MAG: trimethylamine methyltransferase family protein, partial [Deltaproteobacteria bacterium]|nr:trimethylamine methyltransferase family protein [Deltaproteobacteria bacterium]
MTDRDRPEFRLLSAEKRERIHQATSEVLSQVGVRVLAPEAVDLLAGAGAEVKGDLVKIPRRLVEESIEAAPKSITVYDRTGRPALALEGTNIHFGTGPTIQYILDPQTGQRRNSTMADIEKAARIVDYLPNLDFAMSMGLSGGVDPRSQGLHPRITDRFDFAAMLKNTTKPLMFSTWGVDGLADCHRMALLCRGGDEAAFRDKPFIMHHSEPTSPLIHDRDPLENLLFCAEKSIPLIYVSGPVAGATSPVTLAGSMILANAECLSGLVIAQLKNEGAPVVYGGGISPMDMKTSVSYYGGLENFLSHLAMMEMADFYGLPDFNTGGVSDAKALDHQAAIDYSLTLFQAALVGSNLIHDVDYLESGDTACWEAIIMADEIIDQIKIFLNGLTVNETTLAEDVIDRLGPGGSYLADRHTFEHFRSLWNPQYSDRSTRSGWQKAGAKDMLAK